MAGHSYAKGNGGPKAVCDQAAANLARRIAAREATDPWPAGLGAQMRRVFTQSPKRDLRADEHTLRRWLNRDPVGFVAEMERREAAERAGAAAPPGGSAAPAGADRPPPDAGSARIKKTLEALLAEIAAEARARAV